jgi:hypothetical protein
MQLEKTESLAADDTKTSSYVLLRMFSRNQSTRFCSGNHHGGGEKNTDLVVVGFRFRQDLTLLMTKAVSTRTSEDFAFDEKVPMQ